MKNMTRFFLTFSIIFACFAINLESNFLIRMNLEANLQNCVLAAFIISYAVFEMHILGIITAILLCLSANVSPALAASMNLNQDVLFAGLLSFALMPTLRDWIEN